MAEIPGVEVTCELLEGKPGNWEQVEPALLTAPGLRFAITCNRRVFLACS